MTRKEHNTMWNKKRSAEYEINARNGSRIAKNIWKVSTNESATLLAKRIVATRTNGIWLVEATDEVGNSVSTKSETLSTGILTCEYKLRALEEEMNEPLPLV